MKLPQTRLRDLISERFTSLRRAKIRILIQPALRAFYEKTIMKLNGRGRQNFVPRIVLDPTKVERIQPRLEQVREETDKRLLCVKGRKSRSQLSRLKFQKIDSVWFHPLWMFGIIFF